MAFLIRFQIQHSFYLVQCFQKALKSLNRKKLRCKAGQLEAMLKQRNEAVDLMQGIHFSFD